MCQFSVKYDSLTNNCTKDQFTFVFIKCCLQLKNSDMLCECTPCLKNDYGPNHICFFFWNPLKEDRWPYVLCITLKLPSLISGNNSSWLTKDCWQYTCVLTTKLECLSWFTSSPQPFMEDVACFFIKALIYSCWFSSSS